MTTWFLRWAVLLTFALIAGSCAAPKAIKKEKISRETVTRPVVSQPMAPEKESSYIYRRAEKLFSKKKYEEAANLYLNFIADSPASNRMIDNAYFKTGLSWFEMGHYRDALYYFSAVTKRYTDSEVFVESLINTAICHYYLKNYEEAEESFAKATPMITFSGHKSYIFYYRGQIAENSEEYLQAAELYIHSERNADNEALVKTVRNRVERIFHNFLSAEELEKITENHSGKWPAMIAFEELFNLHRREGNQEAFAEAMKVYRFQFPPKSVSGFAVSGADTHEPDNPVIGVALPLTGSGAQVGRDLIQGIQLALNAHHELMTEKRIQLVIKDTASSTDGAEEALAQLADDRNTIAILGPAFSSSFERAAAIAEHKLIPILSPSATAESVFNRGPHLFRNSVTTKLEADKMADLAMRSLGHTDFAVIYPDTPGGKEVFGFFRQAVAKRGGMILAAESYNMDQTDFSNQIKRIGGMTDNNMREIILSLSSKYPDSLPYVLNESLRKRYANSFSAPQIVTYGSLPLTGRNFLPGLSIKYDSIYVLGPYHKVGLIMPQLEFYNLTKVDRLVGRGANHPGFVKTAEKYSEGVVFIDGFFPNSTKMSIRYFTQRYRLAFRTEPSILSAQAYDAANIVLSAIARGASSRRGITNYLESLSMFEGVSGVTTMTPSGDAEKEVFYLTVSGQKIVEFSPYWQEENPKNLRGEKSESAKALVVDPTSGKQTDFSDDPNSQQRTDFSDDPNSQQRTDFSDAPSTHTNTRKRFQ